jgi:hypothetical protein
MDESDNRLLLAGLISGLAVGVLAALLVRRSRSLEEPPLPESGIQLRRRPDEIVARANQVAADAVARARAASGPESSAASSGL